MNMLGVILAGGGANRMGQDKALVEVAGRPMVEWVAQAMRVAAGEVMVVGRSGNLAGMECVADDLPARRGPLAGLATAMRLSEGRSVLLCAVDQPWVRPDTLWELTQRSGPLHAVVPLEAGARQVTCAIYPAAWANRVIAEDTADGTIQSLLDELLFRPIEEPDWQAWGEDGRSWFSVDTEEAIQQGMAKYGTPS